jgi:Cu+-exporting ATPase
MATDPVCGMTVDPTTALKTSDHLGTTFYYCSPACRKMFDADRSA